MLSSQTKDTMTVAAMDRLLEHDFTVQYALDVDIDELGKIIYPVGFWRVRKQNKKKILFYFILFL
jgi:endonuclease-3